MCCPISSRLLLAALACSAGIMLPAGLAAAGPAEDQFPAGIATCYARRYDTRHLDKHPRQKVTFLAVSRRPKAETPPDGRVVLMLEAEVRGNRERFVGAIYCKPEGVGSRCHVEGDGGNLILSTDGRRLRVEPWEQGIGLEGSVFISFGAKGSDDRVLLLDKVSDPATCKARLESEREGR